MHRVLHPNSLEEWVTEIIFGMVLLQLSPNHHKQILPFCITLKQYSVWEWTRSQPWRWYKTYGERKLQHNGNDGWSHTTQICSLIQTEMPGWDDLVSALVRTSEETSKVCWRKRWQQHCRWHSLFLSHHCINNLCDGSQQDFLEELWPWCETTVLSIRNYFTSLMNFIWGVDLVTLGTWSHFSISLSFITSPNFWSISSSLGQANKISNVMPGWWSVEKYSNSIIRDFYSNPVIYLNEIWITSRALSAEGLWQG